MDVLRFLLASWVVLAHLIPWHLYVNGGDGGMLLRTASALERLFQRHGETHPAVLAFIVLSGYCIHRNGFRKNFCFSLSAYAIRRLFRILPLYLLGSLVGVAVWHMLSPTYPEQIRILTASPEITWGCLSIKLAGVAAFFPELHSCSFQGNAPLTTAQVEIWLYVFYGAVVWGLTRCRLSLKWVVLAIATYWAATILYVRAETNALGWWHNGSFVSFVVYWWIGAYFAEFEASSIFGKRVTGLLFLVLLILIFSIPSAGDGLLIVEARKILLAIVFGISTRWVDTNITKKTLLAQGGEFGYDIYALHGPLLIFMLLHGASILVCFSVVMVSSAVCHFIFEKPLILLGKKLAARNVGCNT